MKIKTNARSKISPLSVEETVLYNQWLSWLKNLANNCIHHLHLSKKGGYKHKAMDVWKVIILSALLILSFDEDAIVRQERLCPNGDQVRKYRNSLPKYVLENLIRTIFDLQLKYFDIQTILEKFKHFFAFLLEST